MLRMGARILVDVDHRNGIRHTHRGGVSAPRYTIRNSKNRTLVGMVLVTKLGYEESRGYRADGMALGWGIIIHILSRFAQ